MAFKSTFKCWINMIIAKIMLMSMLCVHSTVTIDCGPIFDPLKDLEYPYDPGTIKWPQTLGTVIYPDNRTVGSVAKFRCEKGYYVHGAKNATCEANGKWTISEKELFCERIRCIEPDFDIKHGKIETSAEYLSPQDYILNSIYWVTCDSGYISNGSAVRVCLVNDTNNDKLYKGIWSQRDENGTMLVGGDTVPECVQDTHIIVLENYVNSTWENYINITDCNKANNLSPRVNTVCGKTTEHVFLGVLGILCLILIVLLIVVLKCILARGKKNTAYNTEFEMQQLIAKPRSDLILIINELIEEKRIELTDLKEYNNVIEIRNARANVEHELDQTKKDKANVEHELDQTKKDKAKVENKLDQTKQEKAKVENKLDQTKKEKAKVDHELDQTKKEKANVEHELDQAKQEKAKVEDDKNNLQRLKELTKGRCSDCAIKTKVEYNPLEKERGRLVNIILKIQRQIAEFTNFDSFILSNKEIDTGAQLLKLIGKLGGLVEGCDTRRPAFVGDEEESEIQGKLEDVTKLGRSLKIPCLHCAQLAKDCEQKEYQIKRLEQIFTIIENQLVNKIENFSYEVSVLKPQCKEVVGLNKLVGKITAYIEDCNNTQDSDNTIHNYDSGVRPHDDTTGSQIPGSSHGAESDQVKPTDTVLNPEIVIEGDTQATWGTAADREEDDPAKESGNKIDKPVLVTSGSKTKNNADPHLNLDSNQRPV